jgi:hypothetical protein
MNNNSSRSWLALIDGVSHILQGHRFHLSVADVPLQQQQGRGRGGGGGGGLPHRHALQLGPVCVCVCVCVCGTICVDVYKGEGCVCFCMQASMHVSMCEFMDEDVCIQTGVCVTLEHLITGTRGHKHTHHHEKTAHIRATHAPVFDTFCTYSTLHLNHLCANLTQIACVLT